MKASAKMGATVAGVAVIAGGILAMPRLLESGGEPAAPEQRLQGKPASTASATPAAPAAPAGQPFTLVATGDIIPYPSIVQRSADDAGQAGEYDFRKILAGVKPWSPPPAWRYAITRYRTGAPAAPTPDTRSSRPRTSWPTP